MQEEDVVDRKRKVLEEKVEDMGELKRLRKIHAVERARFQERLNELIKKNQDKVAHYRE